jgi:hypothetical protein
MVTIDVDQYPIVAVYEPCHPYMMGGHNHWSPLFRIDGQPFDILFCATSVARRSLARSKYRRRAHHLRLDMSSLAEGRGGVLLCAK